MSGTLGFSYIGVLFLSCLFIPNRKVIWLGIAAVILGIGHIGITNQYWQEYKKVNHFL